MFCQNCGTKNKPEAKFCRKCGIALRLPTPPDAIIPSVTTPKGTSEQATVAGTKGISST